jgi:hypothetical protein
MQNVEQRHRIRTAGNGDQDGIAWSQQRMSSDKCFNLFLQSHCEKILIALTRQIKFAHRHTNRLSVPRFL